MRGAKKWREGRSEERNPVVRSVDEVGGKTSRMRAMEYEWPEGYLWK